MSALPVPAGRPGSHTIGGTDAATLVGLGYESPLHLFLRLRGDIAQAPPDSSAELRMEAGKLAEQGVIRPLVERRYGLALLPSKPMALPDEPRIGASPDFEVEPTDVMPATFAEAKLTGSRDLWGHAGSDKIPLPVAAQCQFQMAVARACGPPREAVRLFRLFALGWELADYTLVEDQEVGRDLLQRAHAMLRDVAEGNMPVAGNEADARLRFLARRGHARVLTPEELAWAAEIREAGEQVRVLETRVKELRSHLLPTLGEDTEFVDPQTGELVLTWRSNRFFDEDALRRQFPDVAERATVSTLVRGYIPDSIAGKCMRDPLTPAEQVRVLRFPKAKS